MTHIFCQPIFVRELTYCGSITCDVSSRIGLAQEFPPLLTSTSRYRGFVLTCRASLSGLSSANHLPPPADMTAPWLSGRSARADEAVRLISRRCVIFPHSPHTLSHSYLFPALTLRQLFYRLVFSLQYSTTRNKSLKDVNLRVSVRTKT